MKPKRIHFLIAILALSLCAVPFRAQVRRPLVAVIQTLRGEHTVAGRVAEFGPTVRQRLGSEFTRIGVAYPPAKLFLVGFKQEKQLEVWVSDPPKFLKTYRILGASGKLGPKLKVGDMQVPEGIYRIESLNPNSSYHLALRVNYPNRFDQSMAKLDGRTELGGDIMIHGTNGSIGCLAMGDEASEDLFVLAAETGIDHVSVIISPVDFRSNDLPATLPTQPGWVPDLYELIRRELKKLEKTGSVQ